MPGVTVNPVTGEMTGEGDWRDAVDGRTTIGRQIDDHEQRLAALEAPDAGQVLDLQLRLAEEYDGRVAAEATLAAIRKLVPDCNSEGSLGVWVSADDILAILDGDA